MHAFFWALFALVLAIGIAFLKIYVELESYKNRKGFFRLRVKILGIPIYQLVLFVRLKNHIRPEVFRIKSYGFDRLFTFQFRKSTDPKPILKVILRAKKVRLLDVDARIGLDDAAASALVCGALNIALDTFIRTSHSAIQQGRICVLPDFQQTTFSLKLHCIITLTIADIIRILYKERGEQHASNRKYSRDNHVRA